MGEIGVDGKLSKLEFRNDSAPECAIATLSPKGIYVVTGGSMAQVFQPMFLGPLISMTGTKKMGNLIVRINQKDLVLMKELIEAGKVVLYLDEAEMEAAERKRRERQAISSQRSAIT